MLFPTKINPKNLGLLGHISFEIDLEEKKNIS